MKKLLVLAAIVFVFWNAHRSSGGSEYFHPTSGKSLRFHVKVSASQGYIEGGATVRNDGLVDIDGSEYHKFVINIDGIPGAQSSTSYSRLEKDGIYSRSGTGKGEPPYIELPLPPEVGRKWRYDVNGRTTEREVVSIETVETPKKTYHQCVKVVSKGIGKSGYEETTTYYAPGVGQVKAILKLQSATLEMTLQEP